MVRGGARRHRGRGKKAVVAALGLVGVAFLGGCTSAQGKVAVSSCSGAGGSWQVSGTLTNTDSSAHSYAIVGELLTSDGTEISSAQTSIPSVAGGAAASWQVMGTADPNIEAEGGLACGAKLSLPSGEIALILLALAALLAWVVLVYVSFWHVVKKAGRPGWHGIVPGYNLYVLCKLSDVSIAWFALMFIPWINIVAFVMLGMGVARSFGKHPGFGVGLGLLPPVFFPIIAFGPAAYQGPGGRSGVPPTGWSGSPPAYPPVPSQQRLPAYSSGPTRYPPPPGGWTPPAPGSRKAGQLAPPGSFSYRPGPGGR
ncbi:MAG TPA: DUF5684 domain-containing protein [Actinomycetota bacterium]|nr:DUF5684 domain-containing protein [Actinomycetota bacterium]